MLSEEIELLNVLNGCEIEFGVLDKDGETLIKGFSVGPEGETTEIEMKARDAMFMVEYGSLNIPGKFVLEKCLLPAGKILDEALDKLSDEILKGGKTRSYIEIEMQKVALNIRDMVRNEIRMLASKESYISSKIGDGTETVPAVADLWKLSERIECAVKFTN